MTLLHHLLTRGIHWYLFRYCPGDRVRYSGDATPYTIGQQRYVVRDVLPAYTEYLICSEQFRGWAVEADLEPWEEHRYGASSSQA